MESDRVRHTADHRRTHDVAVSDGMAAAANAA